MAPPMDDALRYPAGRFEHAGPVTPADLGAWTEEIEAFPDRLREALAGLDEATLDTPYRLGGWTVRQVVHHLADSHGVVLVRFKLALTEEAPAVKAYDEGAWADLTDARLPVAVSVDLVAGLHARWVALLGSLGPDDWARTFVHSERGAVRLDLAVGGYAWHGRHHLAHVGLVVGR